MPERWTRAVLRFRVPILLCWLAVLAVGVVASIRLPGLLSNTFTVPGTDSDRARVILAREFGERPDGVFTVVFPVAHPSDRIVRARLRRELRAAARLVPTGSAGQLQSGGGILFGNIDTTLDLQHAKGSRRRLRRVARGGPRAYVTGQPAIQHDLEPVLSSDLRRGEAIALPIALLILVAVLGLSAMVLIPFVFAACTITLTLTVALRDRAALLHGQLRDEPRRADRARARGRLLAADRVALPRGARPGGHDGRGDRARRWRRPGAPSSSRG